MSQGRACVVYRVVAVAVSALTAWGVARPATDEEIFRQMRFGFSSVGGRAVGMGGAYVAVADDATAVQANPGGLASLSDPQVFAEARSVKADDSLSSATNGSLEVNTTTGARSLPYLEVTSFSTVDTSTKPSFVSFAWPIGFGDHGRQITLAGSYELILDQDQKLQKGSQVSESRVAFDTFPNTVTPGGAVQAYSVAGPVTGDSTTKVAYYSASAGFLLHPDFGFGATVSYATLDLSAHSSTQVEDPLQLFIDPTNPRLPSHPTSDIYQSKIDQTDSQVAWSVGVMWHPDSLFADGHSPFRLGATFHKGPRFNVHETTTLNGNPDTAFDTKFVVPDSYSIGAAWMPDASWIVSLEVERIDNSDILEDFKGGVNFLTSHKIGGFYPVDPAASITYKADDTIVPRIGAEFKLPLDKKDQSLAFQAGYFRQPFGGFYMTSFNSTDAKVNDVYLKTFAKGDTQNYITAGAGFKFGNSTFQAGVQHSSAETQLAINYSYSFSGLGRR